MMMHLKSLEKEVRLRTLFTELAKKKGSAEAVFYLDLFHFFDLKQSFSSAEAQGFWRDHIEKIKHADYHLSLQVDIPFCRQRCRYCRVFKWAYTNQSDVDRYVECIVQEMRSFKTVFEAVKFKVLLVGGGSADILAAKDLRTVFTEIHQNFHFEDGAPKTVECNPNDCSFEKLAVLADSGANRVSFGVQSFDDGVLKYANRGDQSYEKIRQAIADAKQSLGLEVNVDLMIGLWTDTPQTVLESFVKLAELKVDLVSLYPLTPTPHYLMEYYSNQKELFDRELTEKLKTFEDLVTPVAKRYGYDFEPLSHATTDAASWSFVLNSRLSAGEKRYHFRTGDFLFDSLGIGADAWSMITKTVYYKNEGYGLGLKAQGDSEASYNGFFLHDQWYRVFYMVKRLVERSRISLVEYKQQFGSDIRDDFKEPFEKLKALGAVSMTEDAVVLTAKTYDEKFMYLLFFIDNQTVLKELDQLLAK